MTESATSYAEGICGRCGREAIVSKHIPAADVADECCPSCWLEQQVNEGGLLLVPEEALSPSENRTREQIARERYEEERTVF